MVLDVNVADYLTSFIAEQMNKDNTLQAKQEQGFVRAECTSL